MFISGKPNTYATFKLQRNYELENILTKGFNSWEPTSYEARQAANDSGMIVISKN